MTTTKPEDNERPVRLLLTGFGPFLNIKENPSSFVARHLDGERLNITSAVDTTRDVSKRKVEITFMPMRTAYADIDEKVVRAHQSGEWDAIVHVGVAAPYPKVALETGSNRLGYTSPDVDGKHAADQKGGKGIEGDVDRWNIAFDVLQMWRHLQYECGHQLLRLSDDPGSYLCGYTTALSLKWAEIEARKRAKHLDIDEAEAKKLEIPVLFIHIPDFKHKGGPYTELEMAGLVRNACAYVGAEADRRKQAWARLGASA